MANNGYKLFAGNDEVYNGNSYLDQLQAAAVANQQKIQQQKSSNPFESFFNWIGDTAGAIGNTVKDTVGAIGSVFETGKQNAKREATEKSNQEKLNNIAKKYGFNSFNDISDDAWKNNQEMVNELQQATKENSEKLNKQAKDYKENWAVKNTANVKQGDYGANAIKTWNTLADVLTAPASLPASMAINAGQGYLSALGDEMQGKSDLSNINWGNVAKQGTANAAAGVAGGAASGLAGKLGSNASKANNSLLKFSGKVTNSGLGRSFAAGAAGGATGAGLSTAFEGGDLGQILANAAAGAQQGAGQGLVTGAGMGLLNRGVNKVKGSLGRGVEQPVAEAAQEDVINPNKKATLDNDLGTEIPDLERATGWNGEELKIKKKNILNRAGDAFEQTGDAIRNRDVLNKLYSKTADGVYERDSINRLRKLGYEPNSYAEAAKISETTNKFITDVIPEDLKVKNTSLQEDLKKITRNNGTSISSNKIETEVDGKILQALNNSRTDNPNTMDEYDIGKLWKESERLMDLATLERKRGTGVGGPQDADHLEAGDRYSKASKYLRELADNEMQWGDTFDKNVLNNRLKNLGATDADIEYLTEDTNSLADLKRKTAIYEDARQMNKEIGKSAIRRNAVSGTSSNPVNIATQESGVGEILRTAARPIGNATGRLTMGVGKILNKAGDIASGAAPVTGKVGQAAGTVARAVNPQVELPYSLIGRLSGTEEGRAASENPETYAQPQATDLSSQLGDMAYATDGSYVGAPSAGVGTTDAQGVTTVYGNSDTNTMNTNQGGDILSRLTNAMEAALNAGDVTAFGQLADIYNTMSKIYGANESSSASGQQKLSATQQRANAAMNSLNRLEGMNPDLGYNLSGIPVIGDIATLGGNAYEGEAKSLAQQIGYMVSGSNIKQEEAEAIGKAYVPQPFDSDATRRLKLQRAREIISQYQNGYAENPTETYAY